MTRSLQAQYFGLFIVLSVCLFLAVPSHVLADVSGQPLVIDGQTLKVQNRLFRLEGIDAPDMAQTCTLKGKSYRCGSIARTALMDLVAGIKVRCVPRGNPPQDPAVAIQLARCFGDNYDLSEGMVYTGWAMAKPGAGSRYISFENGARQAKRGLWRGIFLRPRDWRAQNRN